MKRSRTPPPTTSTDDKQAAAVVPKIPKWQHAVAGASAGVFSKTAVAPVERVKLLMQLQGSVNRTDFTNPWKVTKHIYHTEGILAFWRGNWPNVLRTAGQAAFNFSFMDYYKAVASSPAIEAIFIPRKPTTTNTEQDLQRRRQLVVSFVSGGLAGATSTTVFYPTEYLRTRLAMDQGRSWQEREYKGMKDVIVKTIRADGILGVYQGYTVALYGSILHRLLYLGGYDAIKNELLHYKKGHSSSTTTTISLGERFLLAQGVSLAAGTLCYPIDSVRRRLMMQAGKPQEARLYRGSLHCFQQVWLKEGLRGFFLGLSPNILRSIGGALMLVSYDALKTLI